MPNPGKLGISKLMTSNTISENTNPESEIEVKDTTVNETPNDQIQEAKNDNSNYARVVNTGNPPVSAVNVIPTTENRQTTTSSKTNSTVNSVGIIKLNSLLKRYTDIHTNKTILSNEDQKQSIMTFQAIMQIGIQHPEKEIYDDILKYFKKNKDTSMSPWIALQGIEHQDKNTRAKLEAFYGVFSKLIENDFAFDLDHLKKLFGENSSLIKYIINKKN